MIIDFHNRAGTVSSPIRISPLHAELIHEIVLSRLSGQRWAFYYLGLKSRRFFYGEVLFFLRMIGFKIHNEFGITGRI
jgi:hypothetical protein